MINDEFEIKINEIIKFLKENGGYKYKLYNHSCPNIKNHPDSNIVEYAEDIRDYWISLTNKDNLYDRIILDILKVIYDNIQLFELNDYKLIQIKNYCKTNSDTKLKTIDYDLLIEFVKEVLIELLNSEYLYDFRNIE